MIKAKINIVVARVASGLGSSTPRATVEVSVEGDVLPSDIEALTSYANASAGVLAERLGLPINVRQAS